MGGVDGVGKLASITRVQSANAEQQDWWLEIEIPEDIRKYVVFKGSISIEGISLTVAKIEAGQVGVAIIPHTYEATNLHSLKPGDPVNIEVDVIAKYVEKMLQGGVEAGRVTYEKLMAEGF
jgi:riboflavin synthase